MQPSDLAHLVTVSDPRWHPDGDRLVVVETRVDLDDDRYRARLLLHRDGQVRPLTQGPGDRAPRWSPDGRTLAFLRTTARERDGKPDGEHPQLALLPVDGGEARVVTDLPLGVSSPVWSPDGRSVVVVGTEWVEELADLTPDERARRPRRITRLPYRVDGEGWVHQRRAQLWLVDVAAATAEPAGDGAVRRLTDLPEDIGAPAWHPDGDRLLAITRPEDVADDDPSEEIVEVDAATGEVRRAGRTGSWAWVGFDAQAQPLAVGLLDPLAWPDNMRLWRLGDGDPVDLTGHLDRDVTPGSPAVSPPGARIAGTSLLTALEDEGRVHVVRVTPPGQPLERVVDGDRSVTGFDVHPDGSTVAVTWTDVSTPSELSVVRDGGEEVVTDLGERFRGTVAVRPTQRWRFTRDDAEVDAWTVTPDGFDEAPAASVPVLINIHGGPTSQYGEQFFDEFQVEAAAGYLVVGSNPRGSSGRGAAWARAVVGAWPDADPVDLLDLRALADAVLERYPQADPSRLGIMGGSYGGYATARIIADDHRYASAVVERGLLAWGSFSGTSDIGPYFDRMFLDASFADDPAPHHAASPLFTAGRVTTPTLVLHSEEDWRCPVEQAERYFVALRRAGVDAELLRFPGEGHELSRSGSPKHRVERFAAVLDWHGRHLRDATDPAGDDGEGETATPPTAPRVAGQPSSATTGRSSNAPASSV